MDLANLLSTKEYLHPLADGSTNFVDLVRSVYSWAGGNGFDKTPKTEEIAKMIGNPSNVIFVIVDGMGVNLMNRLSENSFIRQNFKKTLHSVYPSTTACALTSLSTGEYPSTHGVPGWWMYLDEKDVCTTPLHFVSRFKKKSLEEDGVQLPHLWPLKPIFSDIKHEMAGISSGNFIDTTFSNYSRGYHKGFGYNSIEEVPDIANTFIRSSNCQKLLYIYLFEFDKKCHEFGIDSVQATDTLLAIDALLSGLHDKVCNTNTKMVITADHGQINIDKNKHFSILPDNEVMKYLRVPPCGDTRIQTYHVKSGMKESFEIAFKEQYANEFELISIEVLEKLRLLGPDDFSNHVKLRFGDFVSIALQKATMEYFDEGNPELSKYIGHHSGLTKFEIEIPLIIA